jgi:hypothetical protein
LTEPSHYLTWDTLAPTSDRAGAFYIKDAVAVIISSRNEYLNCHTAKQGGVYSLINSKIQEDQSKFQYNSAIKGGVFYLEDSKLDISNSKIFNSYSAEGGIIYKVGKENVDIKSTIISNTYVKLRGGIAYFAE